MAATLSECSPDHDPPPPARGTAPDEAYDEPRPRKRRLAPHLAPHLPYASTSVINEVVFASSRRGFKECRRLRRNVALEEATTSDALPLGVASDTARTADNLAANRLEVFERSPTATFTVEEVDVETLADIFPVTTTTPSQRLEATPQTVGRRCAECTRLANPAATTTGTTTTSAAVTSYPIVSFTNPPAFFGGSLADPCSTVDVFDYSDDAAANVSQPHERCHALCRLGDAPPGTPLPRCYRTRDVDLVRLTGALRIVELGPEHPPPPATDVFYIAEIFYEVSDAVMAEHVSQEALRVEYREKMASTLREIDRAAHEVPAPVSRSRG